MSPPFLITRLIGANPNTSLSSAFFLSFGVNCDRVQFTPKQLHPMLYFHWQGFIAIYLTTPHVRSIYFNQLNRQVFCWLVRI